MAEVKFIGMAKFFNHIPKAIGDASDKMNRAGPYFAVLAQVLKKEIV
jgi:hypothetical protein